VRGINDTKKSGGSVGGVGFATGALAFADRSERVWHTGRVGGSPAHAVIVIGSDIAPDDLAANYHRVAG
jgi:hypothetical protein